MKEIPDSLKMEFTLAMREAEYEIRKKKQQDELIRQFSEAMEKDKAKKSS